MSLIRLVEPGWESFTGHFAGIDFKDGVAQKEWPESFTDRIAASIQSVDHESGEPLGVAHRMINQRAIEMAVPKALASASDADVRKANEAGLKAQSAKPVEPVKEHTIEEITAIADKDGIVGLRKIADPLGLKGRSISDLMKAIIEYRDAMKPTVAVDAVENQASTGASAETTETPAA